MILIITNEDVHLSVEEVIDWIEYKKGNYNRIKGEDVISGRNYFSSILSNEQSDLKGNFFNNYLKYNVIWFKGFVRNRTFSKSLFSNFKTTNDNLTELKLRYNFEISRINSLILNHFTCPILPSRESFSINKIRVLNEAKKIGLLVPSTLITNSKKDLIEFYLNHNDQVISKSLYETVYFQEGKQIFLFRTSLITQKDLDNLENTFFPSMFQEYIEKAYEIRIFVLNNELYPMAIFSQLDEQTMVDFRNYNDQIPNRTVPYNLPSIIKNKLLKLMKVLNLNTGSIDLIKSKENNYYFLEINPNGQFGMTSYPCNYYLEKKIANFLMLNDKNEEKKKNILR
jgi:ATP-GRASP peptide maturase of grasp-with-spasm system